MKKIIIAIALILAFIGAFLGGYITAIHSAQLVEVTDTEYSIDFNGQIHNYSWEVNE